jgi:ankyrin repeat protein
VNARDHSNRTPLMFAAKHASVEMCYLLVQHKSELSSKNCNGDTALHEACRSEKIDNVMYLVSLNYSLLNEINNQKKLPEQTTTIWRNKEVRNFIKDIRTSHLDAVRSKFSFWENCKELYSILKG